MSIRMHWTLQRAGWLWFRLELGNWRYEANYGWCADFPKDLLACVTALLELDGPGARASLPYVEGDGEPELDRWYLRRTGETLHITLERCANGYQTPPEERTRTERNCSLAEFGAALADSLTELLNTYGLVGYALNWGSDFPVSRYLQLLSWRRGKSVVLREVPRAENLGEPAWTTDLPNELDLMASLDNSLSLC